MTTDPLRAESEPSYVAGRTSIIVPTRGPSWALEATLSSLSVALPLDADVELILVHDGPNRDLSEMITGFGYPVSVQHTGRASGAASARNLGYSSSTGELLIFLDDDTAVPPGWLEAAWSAARQNPEAGLLGAHIEATAPHTLVSQAFGALVIRHERRGGRWYLATACLAVRRDAFERLGGFDERFADASGEDWDLCRRAHRVGIGVVTTESFVVYHRNPSRLRQTLSRSRRYARSAPQRFAEDRPSRIGGTEDLLVERMRRRSPVRIVIHLVLAGPREVAQRYRLIRIAGFSSIRAALILTVHLPWLISYALFSIWYATTRAPAGAR
jgi:GT2 family glycosyltransferase